jgi:hypothetical protein
VLGHVVVWYSNSRMNGGRITTTQCAKATGGTGDRLLMTRESMIWILRNTTASTRASERPNPLQPQLRKCSQQVRSQPSSKSFLFQRQ